MHAAQSEKVFWTMGIKAYKYRISCNKTTAEKLDEVLTLCRHLYNAAVQERRDAYEMLVKRHPGYYVLTILRQSRVKAHRKPPLHTKW